MTMRMLMIIPQVFYSTRGTPISAYHRIRELMSYGHEVDVLTYKPGGAAPDLPIKIYRSHGPHFAGHIKPGPSRVKIWYDVLLFFNLIYRLARRRYDVLYAHEEGAFLARIVGWVTRTPYVYDMHSSLPRQIREWGFSRNQWVVNLFSWVERFCVRGARVVVAISPAVAQVARDVRPDAPVVVIVNNYEMPTGPGALTGAEVRARHGIDPTAKLVVYTGSFVLLQALDMLVAAARHVARRVANVKFLVVGGTEEEIASLAALAAKLDVADRFIFEKNRPQVEMGGYMAAADALVSPRFAGINPPGKLFAYLSSGNPVVATDTLVHNQLLDSSCAILTGATPEQFAEGVITALIDEERRAQVIAGARAFLSSYCSAEARRSAYVALTNRLSNMVPATDVPH
jgi:glycosyltransferase involved in cell wall biosynthesis